MGRIAIAVLLSSLLTGSAAAGDGAPKGFRVMEVAGVAPTDAGHAVLLVTTDAEIVVPIFVGETEALSISLRTERRQFDRPLTHDLLDRLVRDLGGKITEVRIDDLRSGTYVATLYVEQGGRKLQVDARASDSIALAVGNRLPIYVADKVIADGGIPRDEIPVLPSAPTSSPPKAVRPPL